MQADEPTDYVVATGTSYSVGDFVRMAFEHVGLEVLPPELMRIMVDADIATLGSGPQAEPAQS